MKVDRDGRFEVYRGLVGGGEMVVAGRALAPCRPRGVVESAVSGEEEAAEGDRHHAGDPMRNWYSLDHKL